MDTEAHEEKQVHTGKLNHDIKFTSFIQHPPFAMDSSGLPIKLKGIQNPASGVGPCLCVL